MDALPEPIADMVRAVAEATQTDPAMAAHLSVVRTVGLHRRHAEIEIRQGWREPLVLYTATIAASGERKSAVQQAMVSPIFDVEEQLGEAGDSGAA